MVHRHPTPEELATRAALRAPMSRALRSLLLGVCALLWLSGALWLLLEWVFPQHNEFGPLPNPWEAPLLRVHGLVAVAAVFLFGWVAAGHIRVRWWQGMNRPSGLWLLGLAQRAGAQRLRPLLHDGAAARRGRARARVAGTRGDHRRARALAAHPRTLRRARREPRWRGLGDAAMIRGLFGPAAHPERPLTYESDTWPALPPARSAGA